MKFIHIADVNLGAQPDRGRIWSDVRAKEIYSTFHRVIEVCEEQKKKKCARWRENSQEVYDYIVRKLM